MNPSNLCPRYPSCSVNNCPLDPSYPELFISPLDKHKSCPMEKGVRTKIANQFAPGTLKLSGLKRAEYAAKMAFEAKPVALRIELAKIGRESLQRLRNGF